jgi:cysteine synthase
VTDDTGNARQTPVVCDRPSRPLSRGERTGRSIVEAIGNTPLLRIRDPELSPRVEVYAKLEFFNPGGSVKDRPAMRMIEDGERARDLRPGKIILDSTSENTGIADAMIGAALGSQVRFAMPAIVSPERRAIRRPTASRSSFPRDRGPQAHG